MTTLLRFADAVRWTNPFQLNRVTETNGAQQDVPEIHKVEFERLTRAILQANRGDSASGVLLLGAAGLGKSHLLARLVHWADEKHGTVVVLHNLLASPERMARYLLSATLSVLAGARPSAYAQSKLYALLNQVIINRFPGRAGPLGPSTEDRIRTLRVLSTEVDPSDTVMPALITFLQATLAAALNEDVGAEARALAAVRWLSGDTLDPEEAQAVGVKVAEEDGARLRDDADVAQVLLVLSKLSSLSGRALVLCLDQVDNLDPPKVTALAAFLQALVDHGKGLAVIVSGVRETMFRFRDEGIIPEAAWDRLAADLVTLKPIGVNEGRAIVELRLGTFLEPFLSIPELERALNLDAWAPLGKTWLEERLSNKVECRPRDIINWCKQRWQERQEALDAARSSNGDDTRAVIEWLSGADVKPVTARPPLGVDAAVLKKVVEGIARRELQPETLPPDADNLATLTETLLTFCQGQSRYSIVSFSRVQRRQGKTPPTYDLKVDERSADGQPVTNGVTFLTADSGLAATHALRRMAEDPDPPSHRILVTDDERRPLRLGKAGQQHYESLQALGKDRFTHLRLKFRAHAELDALSSVISQARVGDLEVEEGATARTVSEQEVVTVLHEQGRFLANPLLHELLVEDAPDPTPHPHPVIDKQRVKEIIRAELSWRIGLMAREIASLVAQKETSPHLEGVWKIVKDSALELHNDGLLVATALDEDLFLKYRNANEPS